MNKEKTIGSARSAGAAAAKMAKGGGMAKAYCEPCVGVFLNFPAAQDFFIFSRHKRTTVFRGPICQDPDFGIRNPTIRQVKFRRQAERRSANSGFCGRKLKT
jgi:hypothetical protein